MKTTNRSLTAFEAYKDAEKEPAKVRFTTGKIKKKKKSAEARKLKKAAAIAKKTANLNDSQTLKTKKGKKKLQKLGDGKQNNNPMPNGMVENNEMKSAKTKQKKKGSVNGNVNLSNGMENEAKKMTKKVGSGVGNVNLNNGIENKMKKAGKKKGTGNVNVSNGMESKTKTVNKKMKRDSKEEKVSVILKRTKKGVNEMGKKGLKKKNATNFTDDDLEMSRTEKRLMKSRQADLKRKIDKVKKLVNKKGNKGKNLSIDDIMSDSESEDFGDEVEEGEVNEEEDWSDDEEMSGEDGEMAYEIEAYTGEELSALNCQDSRKQGQETFKWIIGPYSEEDFFNKFWEKGPLLIKRNDPHYYKGLFSTHDLDRILHEQVVIYSKNLDVTSYSNGVRETHNPIGQAHAPVVWDYFNNGCSLRMLNPQTFHPRVWKCLSSLQEYFNSFCGANIYLTPPDTQGFAPHWDDIEAFICQLEGKKRWRVYAPRCDEEVLPDYSSPNLSQDSIGEPVLDIVLEAGDLLYFPRGFIHQGNAVENEHSLHITISTYQKNSWGHYLEKFLPRAISLAMQEDVEFRRGLPRDYLDNMGIVHMENETEERTAFKKKVCDLVMRMLENANYDVAVDQRGASFVHDCLPPYLTQEDKVCSAFGGGERWCKKKNKVINRVELQPDTPVRLIRGNCIRLVAEEENVHIYHCLENSREYHREEPQFLEVALENAPAVETLIHMYPKYVPIETLPLKDDGEKMTVASGLWERGLLVTAQPLDAQYDD